MVGSDGQDPSLVRPRSKGQNLEKISHKAKNFTGGQNISKFCDQFVSSKPRKAKAGLFWTTNHLKKKISKTHEVKSARNFRIFYPISPDLDLKYNKIKKSKK